MAQNNYKTTDGLMRHLRNNGIQISGSNQKSQLVNYGYYHGYKAYRFMKHPKDRLPITDFKDVYALIKLDTNLKAMFYPQLMFIETALKNISLIEILREANSHKVEDMQNNIIVGYNSAPNGTDKAKAQRNKLSLQNTIYRQIAKSYEKQDRRITHFYNSHRNGDVPLWAVFEILTLGNFGFLISCLNINTRELIEKKLDFNLSIDTNRTLLQEFIFIITELRNAVAHNDVIYDTRFKKADKSKRVKLCLTKEFSISSVNFDSIIDYVVLVTFFLLRCHVPKREIKSFLQQFESAIDSFQQEADKKIYAKVIHFDTQKKLNSLKMYVKQI